MSNVVRNEEFMTQTCLWGRVSQYIDKSPNQTAHVEGYRRPDQTFWEVDWEISPKRQSRHIKYQITLWVTKLFFKQTYQPIEFLQTKFALRQEGRKAWNTIFSVGMSLSAKSTNRSTINLILEDFDVDTLMFENFPEIFLPYFYFNTSLFQQLL